MDLVIIMVVPFCIGNRWHG